MRLRTSARLVLTKFKRRNLGLVRILLFPLARCTDEFEVITLGLFGRVAVALAMLPNLASVTCDAVRAIVPILAVLSAD